MKQEVRNIRSNNKGELLRVSEDGKYYEVRVAGKKTRWVIGNCELVNNEPVRVWSRPMNEDAEGDTDVHAGSETAAEVHEGAQGTPGADSESSADMIFALLTANMESEETDVDGVEWGCVYLDNARPRGTDGVQLPEKETFDKPENVLTVSSLFQSGADRAAAFQGVFSDRPVTVLIDRLVRHISEANLASAPVEISLSHEDRSPLGSEGVPPKLAENEVAAYDRNGHCWQIRKYYVRIRNPDVMTCTDFDLPRSPRMRVNISGCRVMIRPMEDTLMGMHVRDSDGMAGCVVGSSVAGPEWGWQAGEHIYKVRLEDGAEIETTAEWWEPVSISYGKDSPDMPVYGESNGLAVTCAGACFRDAWRIRHIRTMQALPAWFPTREQAVAALPVFSKFRWDLVDEQNCKYLGDLPPEFDLSSYNRYRSAYEHPERLLPVPLYNRCASKPRTITLRTIRGAKEVPVIAEMNGLAVHKTADSGKRGWRISLVRLGSCIRVLFPSAEQAIAALPRFAAVRGWDKVTEESVGYSPIFPEGFDHKQFMRLCMIPTITAFWPVRLPPFHYHITA